MSEVDPIKESLRRVRRVFEQHGISDDVSITEHVSFLLLVGELERRSGKEPWDELSLPSSWGDPIATRLHYQAKALATGFGVDESQLPQPPPAPPRLTEHGLRDLIEWLKWAVATCNDDAGRLFQRYIRSELLRGTQRGEAPVPHHIVTLMARLLLPYAAQRVLDPACGTGGLLVAALDESRGEPPAWLVGVELHPNWAALGTSNLILNSAPGVAHAVLNRSFLLPFPESSGGAASRMPVPRSFTRLLVAPPFKNLTRDDLAMLDRSEAHYGKRLENAIVIRSIGMLEPGGLGAVLLPRGALSIRGEQRLRDALFAQELEAVVALPRDAFQPHNSSTANLVVFRRGSPKTVGGPIWFARLEQDGYSGGAGRDLTQPPGPDTELPLVQALLEASRAPDAGGHLRLKDANGRTCARARELRPADALAAAWAEAEPEFTVDGVALEDEAVRVLVRRGAEVSGWFVLLHGRGPLLGIPESSATSVVERWKSLPLTRAAPASWGTGPGEGQGRELICSLGVNGDLKLARAGERSVLLSVSHEPDARLLAVLLVTKQGERIGNIFHGPVSSKLHKLLLELDAPPLRGAGNQDIGRVVALRATGTEDGTAGIAYLVICWEGAARCYRVEDEQGTPSGSAMLFDNGVFIMAGRRDEAAILTGSPLTSHMGHKLEGLVVTQRGRVLGVRIAREQVTSAASAEPDDYLPTQEASEVEPAVVVIAQLRRAEEELRTRLENLTSLVGGVPRDDGWALADGAFGVGGFSPAQAQLWELLQSRARESEPFYFDQVALQEIADRAPMMLDEVAQQLRLFESKGLVVRITVRGTHLYRLTAERDLGRR